MSSVSYSNFIEAYKKAHPEKPKSQQYKDGIEVWNGIKKDKTKLDETMSNLQGAARRHTAKYLSFWSSIPPAKKIKNETMPGLSPPTPPSPLLNQDHASTSNERPSRTTPAQDMVKAHINESTAQLNKLSMLRDAGILPEEGRKKIKKLQEKLKTDTTNLKKLRREQERQRSRRSSMRTAIEGVCADNPDVAQKLTKFNRQEQGRPRVEVCKN